jgi:hypothetical protein
MPRLSLFLMFLAVLALVTAIAQAQEQAPSTPPTAEQVMVRVRNNTQKKLIELAKDVPEDKLNYRPHPDVRSFLEEIWHMTASNQLCVARLKGEQVDFAKLFSNEGRRRQRAQFVGQLESSARECAHLLEKNPNPRVIGLIEHAGEYYGKLVTMYRVNGLVPPATRAQQQAQQQDQEQE